MRPAVRVVVGFVGRRTVVEDLPNRLGSVAVVFEVLRQRRIVADEGAPVVLEVVSQQRVGPPRRQHRVATRGAERLIGVDVGEGVAALHQQVHVRCAGQTVA